MRSLNGLRAVSAALAIFAATTVGAGPLECNGEDGACDPAAKDRADDGARADLEQAVHDYLLAHGDVVLQALQDNQKRLADKAKAQALQVLAASHDVVFDNSADPVIGNPKGDVTVVEWFDNECPFCKSLAPTLLEVIKADPNVRVVFKELPILGPMSVVAAKIDLAAQTQGRYAAFHAAMMADQTVEHKLTEDHIYEVAASVGLDVVRLKHDAAKPEYDEQISANRTLAKQLGVTSTPGLILGNQIHSGAMPYDALVKAIADIRAAARSAS